jgi:hypothetical protein
MRLTTTNAIIAFICMFAFLSLILSIVAHAQEDEHTFYYGDCVKVTQGFYRDCVGRVQRVYSNDRVLNKSYTVYLTCKKGEPTSQDIDSESLELQKDKVCGSK